MKIVILAIISSLALTGCRKCIKSEIREYHIPAHMEQQLVVGGMGAYMGGVQMGSNMHMVYRWVPARDVQRKVCIEYEDEPR